jgi:uncharacterized MAPEG superfamily protein
MTTELYWLVLTALMTALFWVPYILDRIATQGLMNAMGYPKGDLPAQSAWAIRAQKAHSNAIENLAVFAPLVLALHVLGLSTGLTASAAAVYFFARLVHYIVYLAAIPVARTLAFAVGWAATIVIGLTVLGVL